MTTPRRPTTNKRCGPARLPAELQRTFNLQARIRECERADLEEIAAAWDCSPATVAWALLSVTLAELRGVLGRASMTTLHEMAAESLLNARQARALLKRAS